MTANHCRDFFDCKIGNELSLNVYLNMPTANALDTNGIPANRYRDASFFDCKICYDNSLNIHLNTPTASANDILANPTLGLF